MWSVEYSTTAGTSNSASEVDFRQAFEAFNLVSMILSFILL